jgi:signal transduction histidine kinase
VVFTLSRSSYPEPAVGRYLVTGILVAATVAFVGWTVWLFADPSLRRYRQVSRELVIQRLAHIEKALLETTVAVALIPDSPREEASQRWRAQFLAYRRQLEQLDYREPSVQAIGESLSRIYALAGQAEEIRRNILANALAAERRKAEELNFHRLLQEAAKEARAASGRLLEMNDRQGANPLGFPLYPLFGSLLSISLLSAYLQLQRRLDRMASEPAPQSATGGAMAPPYFEPNGMDALRRFAGRVAHTFNNLLTPVTGYADLLLHSMRKDDPNRRDVEEIQKAGNRAGALAAQLLAFAGRQVAQRRETDFNALLRNLEGEMREALGGGIELSLDLDARLPKLKIDPCQFAQVVMSLVRNARDAMPGGGSLAISTTFVAPGYAVTPPSPLPAPCLLLKVSDSGAGMDEITRQQIFEPFFTTKEPGKGLGLGLTAAYGIVRQAGGVVRVMSNPGQGTSFLIYLPIAPTSGPNLNHGPFAMHASARSSH